MVAPQVTGRYSPPPCHDEEPDRRTRLALAIAAPGSQAMYLDADNACAGWAPIPEAAASGRPYCVEVADGLLPIDADRPDAEAVLAPLVREARAAGATPVLVASGRPGHRHLLVRLPRADRRRLALRARALGLDVRTGSARLRPPLSPHRLGLATTLVDLTPDEALEALSATSPTSTSSPQPLRWEHLLRTGRWPTSYVGDRSGSALVFAIARGAVRADWNLERLAEALADPTNAGGEAYRRRKPEWLTRYAWPAASASAAARPPITCPEDVVHELDKIAAGVEATRWPGVGGATERALLGAVIAAGHDQGSVSPWAGHRWLADQVGVHRNSITAAAARLRAKGWLEVKRAGRCRTVAGEDGELVEEARSTVWHLRLPEHARTCANASSTPGGRTARGTSTRVAHDACRWGGRSGEGYRRGLGLNVPRVLDALAGGPLDTAALAERLGMSGRHLGARLLPKLAGHGLVSLVEGRWHLAEDHLERLDAAAEDLGLAGAGACQRRRHVDERRAYLDWRHEARETRAHRCRQRRRAHRAAPQPPPPDVDPDTGEIAAVDYLAVAAQGRAAPPPPATRHRHEDRSTA